MGILRKHTFLFHIDSEWTDYTGQDIADYKGIMLSYVILSLMTNDFNG